MRFLLQFFMCPFLCNLFSTGLASKQTGHLWHLNKYIFYRYNFERLCNNLQRVERLIDLTSPIKEAYFPKLDRLVTNRSYPGRVQNQVLQNLRREGLGEGPFVDIDDLKRWRDTILGAIHSGVVRDVSSYINRIRYSNFCEF